jgi:hypothetical protein
MHCALKYEPLPDWNDDEIRTIVQRGEPSELLYVPLVVSMNPPSRVYAEQVCIRFASHRDPNVRGNAIEGFGHIARIYRSLNKRWIEPMVENARSDPDDWVRAKAEVAADEIEWFCGWVFRGREERLFRPVCPCPGG